MNEPSVPPEFDTLIAEYRRWQDENRLILGSADEHLFDEHLTDAQKDWLRDFLARWETALG